MDQDLVTYLDRQFSDLDGRFSHELLELRRDTGAQIRQVHVLVEGLRDAAHLLSTNLEEASAFNEIVIVQKRFEELEELACGPRNSHG